MSGLHSPHVGASGTVENLVVNVNPDALTAVEWTTDNRLIMTHGTSGHEVDETGIAVGFSGFTGWSLSNLFALTSENLIGDRLSVSSWRGYAEIVPVTVLDTTYVGMTDAGFDIVVNPSAVYSLSGMFKFNTVVAADGVKIKWTNGGSPLSNGHLVYKVYAGGALIDESHVIGGDLELVLSDVTDTDFVVQFEGCIDAAGGSLLLPHLAKEADAAGDALTLKSCSFVHPVELSQS